MTRGLVMGLGGIVDALVSGVSMYGGGGYELAAVLWGVTAVSPIVFFFAQAIAEAFEQPEVLTPPQ